MASSTVAFAERERKRQQPSHKRYEDPRDQAIVELKERLDDPQSHLRKLDGRRGWLWAAVIVPLLYTAPMLWLENRQHELISDIGLVGLALVMLLPLIEGS